MLTLPAQELEKFLSDIGDADCEFLSPRELDRFPAVCCGMANGDGGWIVLGATYENDEPEVEGVADPVALEQQLRLVLRNFREISFDPVLSFQTLSSEGRKLPVVKVAPADWRKRPVRAGGVAYRRVEGVDLVSGQSMRVSMALDALEVLRDDHSLQGLSVSDLNARDASAFREAVVRRNPLWEGLSEVEFLKRTLVLDASGTLTRAGQLLLGEGEPVRAVFKGTSSESVHARNLWSACTDLLPRLAESVSRPCVAAIRECFLNALSHADYDAGSVEVERGRTTLMFSNPGLPRAKAPGDSVSRNYRLMRMFVLAGLAHGEGRGLEFVRAFDRGFRLRRDVLELRTVAELSLEIASVICETGALPAAPDAGEVGGTEVGWMPVLQKEQSRRLEDVLHDDLSLPGLIRLPYPGFIPVPPASAEEGIPLSVWVDEVETFAKASALRPEDVPFSEEPVAEILPVREEIAEIPEVPVSEESPIEEPQPEETFMDDAEAKQPAFGDAAHELEEYVVAIKNGNGNGHVDSQENGTVLDRSEAEDEKVMPIPLEAPASSKAQMVRETPRLSASAVREAILELCGEYRSISELASLLSRSENSLRRHYLTAMVREGLLEMEFPENVGRPDQRYRISTRKARKTPKRG